MGVALPEFRACSGGTDPAAVAALLEEIRGRLAADDAGAPDPSVLLPVAPDAEPSAAREVAARVGAAARRRPAEVAALLARTDVVLQTSGSTTGRGHLVGQSWRALTAGARATHDALAGPGLWLVSMPVHHVAGFQVLVRSAIAGTSPGVLDLGDGFRAEDFAAHATALLARADGLGLPAYASLVPTQLVRVVADAGALALVARFDAVLVGGAATPPTALAAAREAGVRAVTTYGMSETGGGCVYDGRPLAGVQVEVEPGTDRILVRGPVLAAGYLDDPEGTRETFRDGSLVTSDRGRWDGNTLTVLGRTDDVLVTGGVKVDPGAVERALLTDGAREACVVGVPDPEWGVRVVAVLVPSVTSMGTTAGSSDGPRPVPAGELERLRALVRSRLGAAHAPREVLHVPALPLRGPGKVDRRAVAALAAAALDRRTP